MSRFLTYRPQLSLQTLLRPCFTVMVCSTLLTACGSDSNNDKTSSSTYGGTSAVSSVALQSSIASSLAASLGGAPVPASSAAISSAAASISWPSSQASSSVAVALVPPVGLSDIQLNAIDGDYFVASGDVWVGMPDGGNTSFINQKLNRDKYSLYTFANDTVGISNCNGPCLEKWPPLLASANAQTKAPYSIVERSMGTAGKAWQWAYQGKPLYFFKNDLSAGQTLGKAVANWQLARPQPVQLLSNVTFGSHLGASGKVKLATAVTTTSAADYYGQTTTITTEQTSSELREGFTLYTFDNDTTGVSKCIDSCLVKWPALIAHAGAVEKAPYSLVKRSSGELQWALNGMPLYLFAGDTAAGETKGEAVVGSKWHVARAVPVAVNNHATKGRLFVGHGNIVNAAGASDNLRADYTLYTFNKDTVGQSNCKDGCLANWPPLYAPADAQQFGDFSVIIRDLSTGVKQWAYKGKALYFYMGDGAPNDVKGEIANWTIAQP